LISNSENDRKVYVDEPQAALLAEYQALRNESLQCAQIISTAVWVGVSSYVVTMSAVFAVLRYWPVALIPFLGLLCLQALAASMMFLFGVWKYARVGAYIREYIESRLIDTRTSDKLLHWEHWIEDKRPKCFYVLSLILLQTPVLCIGVLFAGCMELNGTLLAGVITELAMVGGASLGVLRAISERK